MTVTNAAEVTKARELLAAVEQENKRKASEREAKKAPQPKDRPTGAKSVSGKRAKQLAAKRARSRSTTTRAIKVA